MGEPLAGRRGNPCKGCTDRHEACWGHCKKPEFLKWRAEQETIRRNKAMYNQVTAYTVAAIERSKKGSGR